VGTLWMRQGSGPGWKSRSLGNLAGAHLCRAHSQLECEQFKVNNVEKHVVAIRTPSARILKAFDVGIDGENVYANYSSHQTREAHSSYHASGWQHTKVGGQKPEWDGGLTGRMEPMRFLRMRPGLVTTRSEYYRIGWPIGELDATLFPLVETAHMLVDTQDHGANVILGFVASVFGPRARERSHIVGFPIIASQIFGSSTRVEVTAFVLTEAECEKSEW
jgi:hypothetical protein